MPEKGFMPNDRQHPFLTGVLRKGEPMEPEVWMLTHPANRKFKIAIRWASYKDDKPFTDYVLAYCINNPLMGTPRSVLSVGLEHRIFGGSNWYTTRLWLDNSVKDIICKAFDEAGITLGVWPAEKDPEKAFVCGLKDNDLKFFPFDMKADDNPIGIIPGKAVLMESDLDPMPELPKLSDVEKEYAMQEATDSLLKAVFPEKPKNTFRTQEMQDMLVDVAQESLKPCPHCGAAGQASLFSWSNGYFSIMCLTCDARGPKALEAAAAIEKWNERNYTRP